MFSEGKYPDPTLFISGHLTPDCPKHLPSYAQAACNGASKGKKNKSSLTAAKAASASNLAPVIQAPRSLPTAERRLYAPRSSPSEHPQAPLIAATFPDITLPASSEMQIVSSPSQSPPRLTTEDQSPFLSPTLQPPPQPLRHPSTPFPASSTSLSPLENRPGCPSASPPTKHSSRSTRSHSPSSRKTRKSFSRVLRSRSSTPKTFTSSPRDISTPTHNPETARLPPRSSFPSTLGTYSRWVPQFDCSPDREQLNALTHSTDTRSARTAGDTAMSPPGVPPPIPFAPSAPSTTPGP